MRSPEKKQRLRSPEPSPSPPAKQQDEQPEKAADDAAAQEEQQPKAAEPAAAPSAKQEPQQKQQPEEEPAQQQQQPKPAALKEADAANGVAANPTPAEAFADVEPAPAAEVTKLADVTGVQQVRISRSLRMKEEQPVQ